MNDWRPIETAPKDRRILALVDGRVVIVKWDDDRYSLKPRPYWWQETLIRSRAAQRNCPPTHWLPLPEAPERVNRED